MKGQERAGWAALGFGAGVTLGVVVGWLTAGKSGQRLRAELRQRLERSIRMARESATQHGRDVGHRMQAAAARARAAVHGGSHYVDGQTLVDQVRSRLGREFKHVLEAVNINAVGHRIHLHGTLADEAERERFIAAVAGIDGVEAVEAEHLRTGAVAETMRESGKPGGGAGRRDRVGRSGVYPFSTPAPASAQEIKTQKSWGQGERGDAGYEDSGRSELVYDQKSHQLLGGLNEPNLKPGVKPAKPRREKKA